jgi:hypothetical protein
MKIRFAMLFVALGVGGCFGYKPFQPPPYLSESWEKSGVSENQVLASLLDVDLLSRLDVFPGCRSN